MLSSERSVIAVRLPSRAGYVAAQGILFVLLSCLLRSLLFIRFGIESGAPPVMATARIFLLGLMLDAAVAACLFLPLAVWLCLVPPKWLVRAWHLRLLYAATWFTWVAILLLFQAEYFFFKEYSSRFNNRK